MTKDLTIYILPLFLLFTPLATAAQDTPRAELFLGYSALVSPSEVSVTTDLVEEIRLKREIGFINGWNASLSVNANHWLAFTGDFSGHYGSIDYNAQTSVVRLGFRSSNRIHHYLIGPQLAANLGASRLFFRGLIGGVSLRESATVGVIRINESDTGLAIGAGGGVDYHVNDRISWRIFQADYLWYRFSRPKLVVNDVPVSGDITRSNFRLSTGLVFKN
ncbi:MAG: outer membrane protein [Blastocatellia bacterium]